MYFYRFIRLIASTVFRLVYRIEVNGLNNIPNNGRAILCSNHVSLLDPIILAISVPRTISFMAKKELFRNKLFGKLLRSLNAFPVDREGADIASIRKSLKILKDGQILGIFPEGSRMSEMDVDSAKPGISLIGIKSKSLIVPVFINSSYKLFSKIIVNIGKPIDLEAYYNEKLKTEDHKRISITILQSIYSLKSV